MSMSSFTAMLAEPASAVAVLVVEDDVPSRNALVQILNMRGIYAVGVATCRDALAALAQNPAAIILDLMLPDGNGINVLKCAREQNLATRVAILTGADKPMIAQAQALKPDAVFIKPVDLMPL